jgi:hypothetical protein
LQRVQEERERVRLASEKEWGTRKMSKLPLSPAKRATPVSTPQALFQLLKYLAEASDDHVSPLQLYQASRLDIDTFYAYLKDQVVQQKIDNWQEGQSVYLRRRA